MHYFYSGQTGVELTESILYSMYITHYIYNSLLFYLKAAFSTNTITISKSYGLLHMWVAQDGVGKRQMVSESATPGRKRCLVKYYLSNIVLIRCYGTGWVVSRTCHRPRCHPSQHLLAARHPADWGLGRRGWYSSVFLWASGAAAGTFRLGCLPPCSLYLHNLGSLTSGASHWALKNIQHVGLDCVNK